MPHKSRIEDIKTLWLPGEVNESLMHWLTVGFDCAESILGPQWLHTTRVQNHKSYRSLGVTLDVARVGWILSTLQASKGIGAVVSKLQKHDRSAWSELFALNLLNSLAADAEIEVEPFGHTQDEPSPDARIRWPGVDWHYVEIAERRESDSSKAASETLKRVQEACRTHAPKSANVQVLLRRSPTDVELTEIVDALANARAGESAQFETSTARVLIDSSGSCSMRMRRLDSGALGSTVAAPEPGLLSVCIESGDPRLERFVEREARQLPAGHPSIVLIHQLAATRGQATWINRLEKYFKRSDVLIPSGAWVYCWDSYSPPKSAAIVDYMVVGAINARAQHAIDRAISDSLRELSDTDAVAWARAHPDEQ